MVLPNFKAYPSNLLTEVWMCFPHFRHHSRLPLPLPQEGCQTSRGTPASWVSCSVNRTEPPVGRLRRVKGCRSTQQLNNSVIDSTTSSPSQQQCHRLNNIVTESTTASPSRQQQHRINSTIRAPRLGSQKELSRAKLNRSSLVLLLYYFPTETISTLNSRSSNFDFNELVRPNLRLDHHENWTLAAPTSNLLPVKISSSGSNGKA